MNMNISNKINVYLFDGVHVVSCFRRVIR